MEYIPCRERTFPLWLASEYIEFYEFYMYWFRHLLERLGRQATLEIWQVALTNYDSRLLNEILSAGWEPVEDDEFIDIPKTIEDLNSEIFPSSVEGITGEQAGQVIARTPPFTQINAGFNTPNLIRQAHTYEALHLFFDALALLTETLFDLYGKQGELIAYDALLAEFTERQPNTVEITDFMDRRAARFSTTPDVADIFSAGLEVDLIYSSEREVITQVRECEWARYFSERHPRVGYLIACSRDNAAYVSFNKRIRLQRTSTLMEGGDYCDFRVYSLDKDSFSAD